MDKNALKDNKGLSLIEILIAVGLLLIVVAALMRLGITTLNTSDASRMRAIAQQLADESLDYARYYRDNNPGAFFDSGFTGNYTIDTSGDFVDTGLSCDPASVSTIDQNCKTTVEVNNSSIDVYRVVSVSGNVNTKEVTAYVFWGKDGPGFSSVQTGTVLTRWRN
jgi:Tfp pilus assembly protein PilV